MRCFYCGRVITTITGYVERRWITRGDTVERLVRPDTAHMLCALPAKTGGWLPSFRKPT